MALYFNILAVSETYYTPWVNSARKSNFGFQENDYYMQVSLSSG